MRFRQVHLDFHTSEKIPRVGDKFNAGQFQEMLKRGHVDSITVFSKCHHGMSYHNTKIGQRHPGLDFDLLARQIEACRAIDVKTPIYLSAGFDEYAARLHPEWVVVGKDGKTGNPLQAGWKQMNFNSPYLDYLCAQIEEVVEKFDGGDGIFLDIIAPWKSYDPKSLEAMREAGLDPDDDEKVEKFAHDVLQKYYARTTAASKIKNKQLPVFHNSGHISKGAGEILRWQSHLELESLPTGGWGYDHFPLSAKYVATLGKSVLGMTGKFHTTWGEFGGFKRPEALRYECGAMLAFGARCSIGDQLHPSGEMNEDTYALIGAAYAEVEANESFVAGAKPVSEIALVSPEAARGGSFAGHNSSNRAEEGAARMLLELHHQFDVIDLEHDLSNYKLVILPDEIILNGAFLEKMKSFLADGGRVLLSGVSGMNENQTAFLLGAELKIEGKSQWNPDYIIPTELAPSAPVRGPFVIHGGAWNILPQGQTRVLAQRADPYFNRTWEHFCSHQHTPDAHLSEFPAATSNGQIAYFAHEIFTRYRQYGQPLYRDLIADAINDLLENPVAQFENFPSQARTSLTKQDEYSRYVLHLLYATPVKRGADHSSWGDTDAAVEIIEDIVPLYNVKCVIRVPEKIAAVKFAPSGAALEYSQEGGEVTFTVPKFKCHQMIELAF
jgi:hypothetical protein